MFVFLFVVFVSQTDTFWIIWGNCDVQRGFHVQDVSLSFSLILITLFPPFVTGNVKWGYEIAWLVSWLSPLSCYCVDHFSSVQLRISFSGFDFFHASWNETLLIRLMYFSTRKTNYFYWKSSKESTLHLNTRRLEAFKSTSVHSVLFSLYCVVVTGIS